MMHRLARILAVLFVLQLPVAFAGSLSQHTVPDDFSEVLSTLQQNRIIDNAAAFRPDDTLTRAEALALVLRAVPLQIPDVTEMSWKDLPANTWYYKPVGAATRLGLLTIPADNMLRPEKPVTRAQFVTFLYRINSAFHGEFDPTLFATNTTYSDVQPWSWFYLPVTWARQTYLMDPTTIGFTSADAFEGEHLYKPVVPFNGDDIITRKEAAEMLYLFRMSEFPVYYPLEPSNVCYTDDTAIQATGSFTGTPLTSLPEWANAYKEILPKQTDLSIATPSFLRNLLPDIGDVGTLSQFSFNSTGLGNFAVASYQPAMSLTLSWRPPDTLLKELPSFSASSGATMKASMSWLQKVGINPTKFGIPVVTYDGENDPHNTSVEYNKRLEGLPVYSEYTLTPYAPLSLRAGLDNDSTTIYVTMDLPQVTTWAEVNAPTWEYVMDQIQHHDTTLSTVLSHVEGDTYEEYNGYMDSTEYHLRSAAVRYTSAQRVYYRTSSIEEQAPGSYTGATFYVPAVRLEGRLSAVTTDGETLDLGPVTRMITAAGDCKEDSSSGE